MNENFSDNNQPISPVLDATQRQVLDALRAKELDEYPLGDWYLGALFAFQNKYNPDRISQAAQSLRELLEKLPIVVRESDVVRSHDFAGMRRGIYNRWIKDKKRYDEKWKDKKVDGQLDKTLRKIDQYLESNRRPTRRELIQLAIRQIDPMIDLFDPKIQEAKRNQFHNIWMELEGFAHHKSNPDEQSFMECLSTIDQIIFDLLAPITAQNQQEIRTILEKPAPTEDDINSMLELIERRGANYRFFFEYAKNPVWIPILKDQDFFNTPPDVKPDDEGYVTYPFWPPISYLKRVANYAPEQVVGILVDLAETDNPHVLREICEIACLIEDIDLSLKLKSWIIRYVKSPYQWISLYDLIIKILNHWIGGSKDSVKAALDLSKFAVSFRADPMSEEKQAHRLENPVDEETLLETSLEPLPRFEEWEYQRILENGIRLLCEKEPYQIAHILIDATASMIRLRMHQEDLDKEGEEDYSEIWCRRLNRSDRKYPDTKEMLVHTLTFACEKVYKKSPESIEGLDQTLRKQRWKVFRRLRQHLYAQNPGEQTLPGIRDFILKYLEYKYYDKWTYDYEFQKMIRKACDHFGSHLLSEGERKAIFDAILSGPSREDSLKRVGDQFTEEGFQQWQRKFHRKQLRPFVRLLIGEYQDYFHELEDASEEALSDKDYAPVQDLGVKWGSSRSPSSPEDLTRLGDVELLTYINTWQEEHRDKDDGFVKINIESLAGAFQTVFKDTIISDEERLAFWMKNRDRIERPIYVRAIVQAIQWHAKEQHYERLNLWFEFCEWVLSQPNVDREEDVQSSDESQDYSVWELSRPDESREQPDWGSSRWAVREFISECLKKDMNVPFTARESLANILRLLCTQFDRRIDHDDPVLLNRNDQITEAINSTRSRALEDLVEFGSWARRHDDKDSVPEVTLILEERFKDDAEYPLTMPERAMLGMCYGSICSLNQSWVAKYKAIFFPQDDLPVWVETFGSFLHFTRPFKPTFEILRDDFAFALDHLTDLEGKKRSDRELTDTLGEHLFAYYLWEVYPLKGEDSLLEKFYEKTQNDPQRWANLSNHVGWFIKKTDEKESDELLEQGMIDRIVAFFDWRLGQKKPEELQKIAFWLETEYLDPDWRLDAYTKILDVTPLDNGSISIVLDMLKGMLESHTAKVVECFAKITDAIDQRDIIYLDTDEAKSILKAGLDSEDESVRENAERAQETLLNAGRDSFLDL